MDSRTAAVVPLAGYLVGAGFAFLVALFLFGLRCDESCGSGGGWEHDAGAWRWWIVLGVGIANVLAALAVVGLAIAERPHAAFAVLAVHVAGAAVTLLYVQGARGWSHQAPRDGLLAIAWAVAGAIGIALAAPPRSG
jgi:hypothetical protein